MSASKYHSMKYRTGKEYGIMQGKRKVQKLIGQNVKASTCVTLVLTEEVDEVQKVRGV